MHARGQPGQPRRLRTANTAITPHRPARCVHSQPGSAHGQHATHGYAHDHDGLRRLASTPARLRVHAGDAL